MHIPSKRDGLPFGHLLKCLETVVSLLVYVLIMALDVGQ